MTLARPRRLLLVHCFRRRSDVCSEQDEPRFEIGREGLDKLRTDLTAMPDAHDETADDPNAHAASGLH
jgi:hypothetical protein